MASRRTSIDRSAFVGNRAKGGGAMYLRNSKPLEIHASTFAGNSAEGSGMAQLDECTFTAAINSSMQVCTPRQRQARRG